MENKLIQANDKIIGGISTKLIEYLDFKDLIFENEFVESFGDSFKLVKLFKTGHDLISRRKFNAFLKGFCYNETPVEEQLSKLYKYINSEAKAEFIADLFSKILMSNSKLACMVMGIMINDLTGNNKDITHNQLVCANSLTSFFDNDIKNYYNIVNFMDKINTSKQNTTTTSFYETTFSNHFKRVDGNFSNVHMTLQKSVANQLFLSEYEIYADLERNYPFKNSVNTYLSYSITRSGQLLYAYIDKISSYLNN